MEPALRRCPLRGGRGWTVWALGGGIVAVALLLFLTLFERTDQVVDEGFSGAARREPYFALLRMLEVLGAGTGTSTALRSDYGGPHTLLVFLSPGSITDVQGAELLGWVARGGHLVTTPQRALMSPFGLELVEDDAESFEPESFELEPLPGERVSVRMWGARRLRPTVEPSFAAGPADGRVVVRYPWQKGQVTFLSDTDFLTNRQLREGEHAEAIWLLLTAVEQPSWVQLLHRVERTSLPALVARHAWMVLLAGALWVGLWIRRRGLRHGPLLPAAPLDRRSLLEHIAATGELFLRHGELAVLVASFRRAIFRRAARHGAGWSGLSERERIERLAGAAGLAPLALAVALKDEPNLAPAELVRRMQILERVEKAL